MLYDDKIYLQSQMQDEGPISVKERAARFQNFINNANSTNPLPASKPAPKTTPPPTVTSPQSAHSPPPSTANSQQQGQIQSSSIVTPSAAKAIFQGIISNSQTNQSNKGPSQQAGSSGSYNPPKPKSPAKESPGEVSDVNRVDSSSRESVKAIRDMLEGKNLNMNQPVQYSKPNRMVVPPGEEEEILIDGSTGERVVPSVVTNENVGTVQGNKQKLNNFFEQQRVNEKMKTEEASNLVSPPSRETEEKPEMIGSRSSYPKEEHNTQNIQAGQAFYSPPGVGSSAESKPVEQVTAQEGNLMARLQKRKKENNRKFESDSDDE